MYRWRKGRDLFLKEINGFMLNETDHYCISPATSKGGFPVIRVICHESVIYVTVHVSHRSEAQGLLRRITKQSDLSPTMADVILDVELARFASRMAFGLWLVDWSPSNLTILAWNTNCDINFTQFSTILVGSTKDYCYPTICLLKSVATLHQKRARGYACSIHMFYQPGRFTR